MGKFVRDLSKFDFYFMVFFVVELHSIGAEANNFNAKLTFKQARILR